jgi:alpha-ketoglutarate-dependent taurine dioxygenase
LSDGFAVTPELAERLLVRYRIPKNATLLPSGRGLASADGEKQEEVNVDGGTEWPLIIKEPMSGDKSFVATYHVASGVILDENNDVLKALDFKEMNSYMDQALAPGTEDDVTLQYTWSVGDLLVWSNRLCWHTATSTQKYTGEERIHHRIRLRAGSTNAVQPWIPNLRRKA